ncbi:MAG TPA: hypothetical protein VIH86_05785, partial [Puia sp.]
MNKQFYIALLIVSVPIFSCRDTDTKAIQLQDSTANGNGGGGKKGINGDSSATGAGNGSSKAGSSVNDSSANKMPVVQSVSDNTKIKTPVKTPKKKNVVTDSTSLANGDNDNVPTAKKAKIAAA